MNEPCGFRSKLRARLGVCLTAFLSACASDTLFKSSFDSNPLEQPPAPMQAVGTVKTDGPAGSVLVVPPPVTPSGRWVRIRRDSGPTVSSMQGVLSQQAGDGTYVFSAFLFIPSGSGIATIQFEKAGQAVTDLDSFLHLDFLPDGTIRIDDGATFGSYARDEVFVLRVTLQVEPAAVSAQIGVSSASASGEADHTVSLIPQARQFGAFRAWIGFPHVGTFDITQIVVTHDP